MLEIMTVMAIGLVLSFGILIIAVAQEHPKRSSSLKNSRTSSKIRDRHLELHRPQTRKLSSIDEKTLIPDNQIIV